MVSLVEKHAFVAGEDLAKAGTPNGQVGKQQVMIHDQQISSGRIASQLSQKTSRIDRTIAAQAEVVLAADALPEG